MQQLHLLLVLLAPLLAAGQNSIFFRFDDGSSVNYAIEEVRSTDFDGTDMRLVLWDGTTYSWSMSSILTYQFTEVTTNLAPEEKPLTLAPLHIYPNPSSGEVRIAFEVLGGTAVRVEVLDAKGAMIRSVHNGTYASGIHTVLWDGRNAMGQPVSGGTYVCRVTQGPRAASKQVVLDR